MKPINVLWIAVVFPIATNAATDAVCMNLCQQRGSTTNYCREACSYGQSRSSGLPPLPDYSIKAQDPLDAFRQGQEWAMQRKRDELEREKIELERERIAAERRNLVQSTTNGPVVASAFDDVVRIAPDTYQISRTDHRGIFGDAGRMKTAVINLAREFAESKRKIAVVLSINEVPMAPFRFASIEYRFLVVDKTDADADARRVPLTKEPNIVATQNAKIEVNQTESEQKPDVYAELIKLDDLRKRGVITEAEFEQQKQKILSR